MTNILLPDFYGGPGLHSLPCPVADIKVIKKIKKNKYQFNEFLPFCSSIPKVYFSSIVE